MIFWKYFYKDGEVRYVRSYNVTDSDRGVWIRTINLILLNGYAYFDKNENHATFSGMHPLEEKQRLPMVLFILCIAKAILDFNELGISYYKEYLIQKDYSSFDLYTKDA